MDIICASVCYRGYAEDEVAATLERAPKIGFRLMEVHGPILWSVDAANAFDLPRIKAAVHASGMRCAGLYTVAWGGKDDRDVQAHAQAIAASVGFAEALGSHHITTTGASRRDDTGALDRVVECVRQVLDLISTDCPVRLTLEPHYGNVLEQPEDFDRVLAAVPDPRVGLCVDTGHFHAAKVDTVRFIHEHASRIYAVHLKDHIGTESVAIGRGEIDLSAAIATLARTEYAGDLTLELEAKDCENLPRYTEEAYVYLSGMLGRKL